MTENVSNNVSDDEKSKAVKSTVEADVAVDYGSEARDLDSKASLKGSSDLPPQKSYSSEDRASKPRRPSSARSKKSTKKPLASQLEQDRVQAVLDAQDQHIAENPSLFKNTNGEDFAKYWIQLTVRTLFQAMW